MPRIYCDAIERTIVNSDRHQKEFGKMFFIFIVLLELSQSTGNVLTVNRGFEGAIPAIPSLSCDFDFDFCSWRNDSSAEFTWIRRQGETPSIYTGPPWDHTTKDANVGHYIYIETSSPRQKGDKARLVSQVIGTAGTYCLRFWHHMHGLNVKDLNVYLKGRLTHRVRMLTRLSGPWSIEGRDEPRVFGEDGDWWNEERVEFNIVEPAQLVLEGVRGENYRGDIAIDDITITQSSCPSALVDCSFDNDTCGWRQMFDDDFNWLPNVGETRTRDTGPSSDHTRADNDGRYLFIEASWPRVEGDKARLLSTDISCATNTSPTFTFWYNMHGTGTGVLRVYTMVGATTNLLWQLSGNQGEDWRRASVQIPTNFVNSNERFNIIIEGERKDYKGDSAIDDITMTGCYITNDDNNTGVYNSSVTAATSTQPFTPINITGVVDGDSPLLDSLSCNFDQQNICGWSHDVNGDFDWTINKGKTLSLRTGPIHDHTSGVGWYIYMEASSPRLRGQTAILRTPPIPASLRICMRFYYHMFGKSMGSLSVFIARASVPRLIPKWSADGQQSSNQSEWKFAEVDLFQTFVYQIIIRGTRGSSFYSDMAIDDITITRGGCRPPQPPTIIVSNETSPIQPSSVYNDVVHSPNIDCNFDVRTTCSWRQIYSLSGDFPHAVNDNFNWVISNMGNTPSGFTGPSQDHTSGRGQFAYIESSNPRQEHDTAILESMTFTISSYSCFNVWYHMYGANTGTLAIYRLPVVRPVKDSSVETQPQLLWQRSGDLGDRWRHLQLTITDPGDMRILIQAVRGNGWRGDIAIDDITMVSGECPLFNCTFDTGTCGWLQDANDDFDWQRTNVATPTLTTGPSTDHTHNNSAGYFMFIEASGQRERGDNARLVSPVVEPGNSTNKCLTFWYHAYGRHIGALNVYKRNTYETSGILGSPLWYQDQNEGDVWMFGQVNIRDHLPYQIIIQGVRGFSYWSDIAIDDVTIADGVCDPCCSVARFKCGNRFCVNISQHCDGVDDCGDGTDEDFCGGCGRTHYTPRTSPLFGHRTQIMIPSVIPPPVSAHRGVNGTIDRVNYRGQRLGVMTQQEIDRIPIPELHDDLLPQPNTGVRSEDARMGGGKVEVIRVRRGVRGKKGGREHEKKGLREAEKIPGWKFNRIMRTLGYYPPHEEEKRGLLERIKRRVTLKITHGNETRPHSWPWQAAYYVVDNSAEEKSHWFCGGTLIDRFWVVTAAHCPQLGDEHVVVLGEHNIYHREGTEQILKVDAIYANKKYSTSVDLVGDIALIKLRFPARDTKWVQPACLLHHNEERFDAGYVCATTGWGRTNPDVDGIEDSLRQAEVPIIDHSTCQSNYWSDYNIHASMVCAGAAGSNSCKGDSGGPLVCLKNNSYYLVGITSWGDVKCKRDIPGVYTRLQSYSRWLGNIMNQDQC